MRRRAFITLLGGAAAWPFEASAQQQTIPVIGFLNTGSLAGRELYLEAFRQGLKETGFVEGQNVGIEYRFAEGRYDNLPSLAADLVQRQVTVIAACGSIAPAMAAKAATTTIPIVFESGGDPVQGGLVASLNQPGGNITGVFALLTAIEAKRLGLLREMVPNAKLIAVLLNPNNPAFASQLDDIQVAARNIGQQMHILRASTKGEIDAAFATAAQLPANAMLVGADAFFSGSSRTQLVALAASHVIPAIFQIREFTVAGGLMSYGTNLSNAYHQVGLYTGQILRGAKPADLPIQPSTRFELVINMKTAKALNLNVPNAMQLLADEVIE